LARPQKSLPIPGVVHGFNIPDFITKEVIFVSVIVKTKRKFELSA
jgi:hypothetical protein